MSSIISVLRTGCQNADDEHEAAFEAPDASEIARQAEHALHRPSSTEDRDPTTSAPASEPRQTSSRRTTTDSLLDRLLHEVDAATLARQRSAAPITTAQPCDATRRDKADAVHAVPNQGMTGPRLAASNSMQSTSSNSNTRRNSASGAAANVQPSLSHDDQTQAPSGYRSTADSVLASVLHEVEHEVEGEADQASIDSLLDGVLAEVAGTASQQRTTADSVLDAMLDDISSSQMEVQSDRRQLSSQHSFQGDHLQQQQLQAVSRYLLFLVLVRCMKCMDILRSGNPLPMTFSLQHYAKTHCAHSWLIGYCGSVSLPVSLTACVLLLCLNQRALCSKDTCNTNQDMAMQLKQTNITGLVANYYRRKRGMTAVWFQAVQGPCCPLLHSPSRAEAVPAMTSLTVMMGYRMLWLLKSAAPSPLLNLRQARLRLCMSLSAMQEAHALLPRNNQ